MFPEEFTPEMVREADRDTAPLLSMRGRYSYWALVTQIRDRAKQG